MFGSYDTQSRTSAITVADLRGFGDRPALITGDGELSYDELAGRVEERAEVLGPVRRLVLIAGSNEVESIVTYLAALAGGHPTLLVPGDHAGPLDAIVNAYDPDVVFARLAGNWQLREQREASAHDLHPDLALLLSTSGSTGSPKLVRLSHDNLRSNAESIADYLSITSSDRAATSLPMHYCYGLSVVNSHLINGAGLVLTDASVVDPCFWDLFASAGATTFAGVPYTFDLLDRCGFADLDLPRLRYITQAGGRLAPGKVAQYAELGRQRGWDFYVMYGQTEATARMAYLPPDLAASRPAAIGVPIPDGDFRLEPTPECAAPDTGELVYSGPNVMMGYAETPADLRLGATLTELHTGDLARRHPEGVFEIIGRRSRFAKVFGLRIDLDDLERVLEAAGLPARCVAGRDSLHVFVTRYAHAKPAQAAVAEHCSLPVGAVHSSQVEGFPTTTSGKTDYGALERHAQLLSRRSTEKRRRRSGGAPSVADIRDLYAELLGRPDATPDSSFVSLGGDSLSYVELSVRLGDVLERLPRDWHTRPIRELVQPGSRRPWRGARLETTVLVRAVAILLIVGTHANLFTVYGGAHCLLGVAGYNFARFQLSATSRLSRVRHNLTAVAQVALPSMAWIGLVALLTGTYTAETVLFLNGLLGSDTWTVQWQFWFLEALVWTLLVVTALMLVPAFDRAGRSWPFGVAVGVVAAGLALRYALVGVEAGPTDRYAPAVVFWCFALGWATAKADKLWQRIVVSVVIALSVIGFFGDLQREVVVATGLLLLWLPAVRAPKFLVMALGVIASSSLYVYLTHWQVYPHLEVDHPLLAVVCSLAVGIVYWKLSRPVTRELGRILRGPEARRRSGDRLAATG